MSSKIIFFSILFFKIVLIIVFKDYINFDVNSFNLVGKIVFENKDIYPETASIYHPYLPFFLYLEGFSYLLRKYLPVIVWLKIIYLFFDLGTAYLVYLISKKKLTVFFLYLLNPITILITYVHGQFDVIPIFFLVLSLYLIYQKKEILSLTSISMGIFIKTWPVLFLIPLLKKVKNKKLILFLPLIPFIGTLIYILFFQSNFQDILQSVLGYRSLFSIWGFGKLIKLFFYNNLPQPPIFLQKIFLYLFLSLFFLYSLTYRTKNIFIKTLDLILFFYIFTFGFAPQYLSWFMPFLIIIRPKNWWLLTLILSIYLCLNYLSWSFLNIYINFFMDLLNYVSWLAIICSYIYWQKNRFRTT